MEKNKTFGIKVIRDMEPISQDDAQLMDVLGGKGFRIRLFKKGCFIVFCPSNCRIHVKDQADTLRRDFIKTDIPPIVIPANNDVRKKQ